MGVEPASGPTRLRLGAVMDWLIDRAAWSAEQLPDQVSLSTGVFQPHIGQYMPASGSAVRLTEKEVEFLKALYQAPGRTLAKSVLLDVVWGYVPGVETHTLETHVYRLRQKIERDPANPQLLVTLDGAYALRV